MKTIPRILSVSLALALFVGAIAARPLAGPKGGRILTAKAPHAEFLVDGDRHVVIRFYDADLLPVAASGQVVTAIAEAPGGRASLAFSSREGALRSTAPLPEGDGYRIVVQIRPEAAAQPANYRIDYHAETCGGCERAEYACLCEGHGAGH